VQAATQVFTFLLTNATNVRIIAKIATLPHAHYAATATFFQIPAAYNAQTAAKAVPTTLAAAPAARISPIITATHA
jgi:hypothetical protein